MATEKETLVAQAEELGIETTDENGKALTISELKVAITAADVEEDGSDLLDDEDDAPLDPDDAGEELTKVDAKNKYIITCTVMLDGRRVEPPFNKRGKPVPVLMTEAQAAPVVAAGKAKEV